MENTNATMMNDVITKENYHVFANRIVLGQLKKFLSKIKQPTEDMTADKAKSASSAASYDRIKTMYNDAIALIKTDKAYAKLCEHFSAYSTEEYKLKKKVYATLKARRERNKKPSKKPRKKPFTQEDVKIMAECAAYINNYEYLQEAMERNRLERDNNNGHSNTACELLQEAYTITQKYFGHLSDDIVETKVYKNGNVKEQTLLQIVRNAVQNAIRSEERAKANVQSYEELTRYHEVTDSDTGEIVGYEEIEPLYIDSMYAIEDYETYSDIEKRIDGIGISQQQERIIKLRLRGYSYLQIANAETKRKIKDECINALIFYGHIDRAEAKKRYAKLAKTMTAYEIQTLMIENGYIKEDEKANPVEKSDIGKQLRRIQEKYIAVFDIPSSVDMAKAKK